MSDWWAQFDWWLESVLENLFPPAAYDKNPAELIMNMPNTTPNPQNLPPTTNNPDILVLWNSPANCRHNVRVICDQEGLTVQQKNDLSATVHCESNYNPKCTHPNIVNGKVSSTDYGIAQINDYWHIGPHKDFPSSDYVLNNPEACIRWMCKQFKAGNARAWVCYLRNMYIHFTP